MDSILTSIKKLLGIEENYTHFDVDIIMQINGIFSVLEQIGIGPIGGFSIKDKTTKWKDYETDVSYDMLKSYIYLKVRLLFDPPQNSFLVNSFEKQISELEWRLNIKEKVTI
ncbi:MAG: hypothetical protein LBD57_04215 [Endomicrobium sp.]|jgi:hypothetical protein|uniref:phage head-tail connector protein n=1 Tax=Candidatus Endomicrobiellum cubanum TaxID=3242325 RepID=UPI002834CFAA|nr:hypothetical protein [Endomicrobium sp.]